MDKSKDLVRMRPTEAGSLRMAPGDEAGNTLVLEPIVFNRWTEIRNPWEGHFMERIAPSAVTKTLAERGKEVKVLFNHGMDPSIGNKPLGPIESVQADNERVRMAVPLSDTSYNKDLKALLRDGAIDGASFRFDIINYEEERSPERSEHNPEGIPERTVTELRLYEAGPVTFPAYQAATAGIRSREQMEFYERTREAVLDTSQEPATEEPETFHSTAAKRSFALRKVNEALADPRNEALTTKEE